ncbi:MAG: hypothetical protein O6826_10775, partial [Acidobacteria bacterium]|nr:hypothetical protein [Acidobacteriota bacterium]
VRQRASHLDPFRFLGREFSQAPTTAAKRLCPGKLMGFLEHEKLNIKPLVTFGTGNPSYFHG